MENLVNMPLVISGVAFISISLLTMGIVYSYRYSQKKNKLLRKIGSSSAYLPEATEDSLGAEMNTGGYFQRLFSNVGKKMTPESPEDYSKLRLRFLKAGIRANNAPTIFLGFKICLMTCFLFGFIVLRLSLLEILIFQYTIIAGIIFVLLGCYLPDIWLLYRTVKRKKRIFEELPDALDLMVVCVEAGLGLDAAIARVGEEMKLSHRTISDEFRLINMEKRAGISRENSLRNFALRTDLDDIRNLTTLLIQTDRFGTSAANTLRIYSDTFRTRRYQKAEEIATKLPVKMLFPLILFIFPSLMLVLIGPAAIQIYRTLLNG